MTDKDLYTKIAQILFDESENSNQEVHLLTYHEDQMIDNCIWWVENTKRVSFCLPSDARDDLNSYVTMLRKYFKDHNMGEWNVMHFTLFPQTQESTADFEFSKGLKNGSLAFWEYAEPIHGINDNG